MIFATIHDRSTIRPRQFLARGRDAPRHRSSRARALDRNSFLFVSLHLINNTYVPTFNDRSSESIETPPRQRSSRISEAKRSRFARRALSKRAVRETPTRQIRFGQRCGRTIARKRFADLYRCGSWNESPYYDDYCPARGAAEGGQNFLIKRPVFNFVNVARDIARFQRISNRAANSLCAVIARSITVIYTSYDPCLRRLIAFFLRQGYIPRINATRSVAARE